MNGTENRGERANGGRVALELELDRTRLGFAGVDLRGRLAEGWEQGGRADPSPCPRASRKECGRVRKGGTAV